MKKEEIKNLYYRFSDLIRAYIEQKEDTENLIYGNVRLEFCTYCKKLIETNNVSSYNNVYHNLLNFDILLKKWSTNEKINILQFSYSIYFFIYFEFIKKEFEKDEEFIKYLNEEIYDLIVNNINF